MYFDTTRAHAVVLVARPGVVSHQHADQRLVVHINGHSPTAAHRADCPETTSPPFAGVPLSRIGGRFRGLRSSSEPKSHRQPPSRRRFEYVRLAPSSPVLTRAVGYKSLLFDHETQLYPKIRRDHRNPREDVARFVLRASTCSFRSRIINIGHTLR